jgi:putative transposase
MPNYRRWRTPGGIVFLTVVTYARQRILCQDNARELLHRVMDETRKGRPWVMKGMVLLPDHMHMLWGLPEDDDDFSGRVALIKKRFTHAWLALAGQESRTTRAQRRWRRRGVWQPRFWEHQIPDARDYAMHLDYIHFNPVKHGLVRRVVDWPFSSFHRYVRLGWYQLDWAGTSDLPGTVAHYGYDE